MLTRSGVIRKPSKETLFFLFVGTLTLSVYTTYKGFYGIFVALMHARLEEQEITGWALPYFWMPSAEALRAGFYPYSLGNFFKYINEWAPVMCGWFVANFFFSLYVYGIAIILRRLWVDIEALPFPYAQTWLIGQLIREETNGSKYKIFMTTLIVMFIFMLPFTIIVLYPPFPDIYGWLKNPLFFAWSPGTYDLTDAFPFIASTIVSPICLQTNPLYYALCLLAPLDILFSGMIGWLVLKMILPQVLYYFGYYSGALKTDFWGKAWMVPRGEPLKLNAFGGMGLFPGVVIFNILLNWRYFADAFKYAFKGGDVELSKEYRVGFLFIVISLIVLIPFLIASNLTIASAIVLLWVTFIASVGFARGHVYASLGPTCDSGEISAGWFYPLYGTHIEPGKETAEQLMSLFMANRFVASSDDALGRTYSPICFMLDSFKIAKMAGMKSIDVVKAMIVASVIGAALTPLINIVGWHYFGLMIIPASKEWNFMHVGQATVYNAAPAPWPWWPHALAGFITAAVLSFLRLRYVWWPLDPMGLALVTFGWNFGWWDTGPMLAICWVIKYIILKVGGRRLYEEYTIPALIGIYTGFGLGVLLVSIAGIVRFFLPY